MTVPRYPYVAVDVVEAEADEATAGLFELGALGVEHRDETTMVRGANDKVTVVASFENDDDARAAYAKLPAEWSPRLEEVIGDAWRDEWKKHFEPFRICEQVVVVPPWRAQREDVEGEAIVLEPGRAFGTGLHETTSLVAEILAERVSAYRGRVVLDVGCGSGILSLLALRLGAARARAIDVDPDAVLVTRENADRNAMTARVDADGAPIGTLAEAYPLVVANIEAKTLVELAPALMSAVAPGGLLVLSGILSPPVAPAQLVSVRAAYAPLREEGVRAKGEWIAVVYGAPP
jgi:ribosomal protein L11 methyltransferase